MDIMQRIRILQHQVAQQAGHKVDLYYMEGYGALGVRHGYPFNQSNVIFAFPDIAIRMGVKM
jgi:hypothetical protein